MKFLRNTFKEMIIALLALLSAFAALDWLRTQDPTMGIPDSSVVILLIWQVVKIYLSVVIGHGLFRLLAPTLANYADDGGFAEDWKKHRDAGSDESTYFGMFITICVALACWLAALTALLLAP